MRLAHKGDSYLRRAIGTDSRLPCDVPMLPHSFADTIPNESASGDAMYNVVAILRMIKTAYDLAVNTRATASMSEAAQ